MALPININELLNGTTVEWERIEFKKGWNPEDVIHSICAFANDVNNWGGGYIIIGVAEEDGKPVLPPVGLETNQLDPIQKKIVELGYKLTPHYFPVVVPHKIQDKNILVVWIPGGDNRPYKAPSTLGANFRMEYYVRHLSVSCKATSEEERQLIELASKIPFDDRINHHADIEDLRLPLIRSFLREIKSDLYQLSKTLPFPDLCRQMQIAKGPDEYLKPVNVGLLLFNDQPQVFFKGASIEVIEYHDDVGDSFSEKKFIGPIHVQLRDALNYLKNSVIKEEVRKVPNQAEALRFFNYPYEALEEALANAVYHRSYEHQSPVEVNIRLSSIDILSFPGPVPPVDNEQLKKEKVVARDYRNRRIGDFLKELHLTEGRSTGIPKIRKAMERNGSALPIFETDIEKTYFLTRLPIQEYFLPENEPITDTTVKILAFCIEPKPKREIMTLIGVMNNTHQFRKFIVPLIESGLLKYTIPKKPNSSNQKYITTSIGKSLVSKSSKLVSSKSV